MNIKEQVEEWWISSEFILSKNQLIAVIVLAVLIISSWLIYYFNQTNEQLPIKISTTSKSSSKSAKTQPIESIYVHVAGAVKKPGVYQLKKRARVIEAINLAGGFVSGADQNSLNLASKVVDSQKIEVLLKANSSSLNLGKTNFSEDHINLNTASKEQLDKLPGIGETMAKRILEYRQDKGSFSSVDELKEIEGIGPKKFEKIKDKVTI